MNPKADYYENETMIIWQNILFNYTIAQDKHYYYQFLNKRNEFVMVYSRLQRKRAGQMIWMVAQPPNQIDTIMNY